MIKDFGNKLASDLYHKGSCKGLPRQYWQRAIHLLEVMEAVESFEELKRQGFPPSVRLHPLVCYGQAPRGPHFFNLMGARAV
jgi:hypothetical protein